MLRVREYENIAASEEITTDTLTGILVDSSIDLDNIVFSVIVNRDSLKEYLKIFEKSTIALHTFKDDYFEVTSDFLLNKRMCNRFVHRLLFTHRDILNSPSRYSSIILDKSLDELIKNITGYDEELVGKIKQHLETIYKDKLKIYNLQNITRDIINIVKGIELCNNINIVSADVKKDQIFDIVEGFDVSLHAFLIMVVASINKPTSDVGVLSNVYESIKKYMNACDIKDVNININNYKQIVDSISNCGMVLERYSGSETKVLTNLTITEILFMLMEIFDMKKTNTLSELFMVSSSCKNARTEILKDILEKDVLNEIKLILPEHPDLIIINDTLKELTKEETNVEHN